MCATFYLTTIKAILELPQAPCKKILDLFAIEDTETFDYKKNAILKEKAIMRLPDF